MNIQVKQNTKPRKKSTMPFTNNRTQTRLFFQYAWQKHLQNHLLEPLEKQLVALILEHPEYHKLLEKIDELEADFPTNNRSNPFLHLGMHLTLRDQIATDMPKGIRAIAHMLLAKHQDTHAVEHRMMECLSARLWYTLQNNREPDINLYLECLKKLHS